MAMVDLNARRAREIPQGIRLLMGVLTLLLCTVKATGQSLPQDPRLYKEVLPNGFTFYIYQQDSTETRTDLHLFVNVGSLQETEEQRGLAHFLEHMAFNGTSKFPGDSLIKTLENKGVRFGSHLNAHTSFDETVYKLAFEHADSVDVTFALDVMHQWAFHITFDSTEVAEEKGIILEEWRTQQREDRRLSESYLPLIFRDSRYTARQPIGDMKVIQRADAELLRSFYRDWYRSDLMALAIVTPHAPEWIATRIRSLFGPAETSLRNGQPNQPNSNQPMRMDYRIPLYGDTVISVQAADHLKSADFSYFLVMPAHRQVDHETAFRQQLHQIFFNALSSARFGKIIQQGAPFRKGSTSVSNLLVHHDVMAGSAQLYADELADGITGYWTEKKRLFDRGFTNHEIENYKAEYIAQLERAVHTARPSPAQSILERIKDDYIHGHVMMGMEDRAEIASRLVADIDSLSLLAYTREIASTGNLILMLAAPNTLAESIPSENALLTLVKEIESGPMIASWRDAVDKIPERLLPQEPKGGNIVDSARIEALDVTIWTLDNGARVYFKKTDFRKDYVTLSAFRKGGIYSLDTSSYLVAQHIRGLIGGSGAGDFTRSALSEYLRGNSASATMVISDHREGVAGSADLKDVRTLFELLYLKWTQPRLDTAVFQQARRDLLSTTKLQPAPGPEAAMNKRIAALLNADTPQLGEVTVDRIRREFSRDHALQAYRERFNGASGFNFIVVGDFEIDQIRSHVLTYVGGLSSGEASLPLHTAQGPVSPSLLPNEAPSAAPEKQPVRTHLRAFGGEPGKAVVQLYFQSATNGLDYPDLLVQKVAEEILKVRLRQRLRDESSGVYTVGTTLSSTNVPRKILRTHIHFSCESERYGFLIGEVYAVLDEMRNDVGIYAILENAKRHLRNSYLSESQRNTFWTSELRNHIYQGYTHWRYLTDFDAMLENIRVEDIGRFIGEHLDHSLQIEAVHLPDPDSQTGLSAKR